MTKRASFERAQKCPSRRFSGETGHVSQATALQTKKPRRFVGAEANTNSVSDDQVCSPELEEVMGVLLFGSLP
jgi:hypothetical protein